MKSVLPLLACLGLAAAPPKLPPPHTPDPKLWKLELSPDLGGWVGEPNQTVTIKLVDPRDPEPPRPPRRRFFEDEGEGLEGGDEAAPEGAERSTEDLEADRKAWDEYHKRRAWRSRRIQLWFNGQASTLSVEIGQPMEHLLKSQPGENRLELLEPDSGLRLVRTWWASAARTRLSIRRVQTLDEAWGGGRLEVFEPNGERVTGGRRSTSGGVLDWDSAYTHATPPPGTYTLRWSGGWRGAKPFRIRIEGSLDAGTDREKRFSFERLFLPGAGSLTLGSVDVED